MLNRCKNERKKYKLPKLRPDVSFLLFLSLLEDSGESFCRISVSDTGIGIKLEDMKKILTAFEQVESSASRRYGGTGLGLTLCKSFLEMHHGSIWVESELNQGSTFTLVLPYVHANMV